MVYDVVVVGAGFGGLQCAYILAKHGLSVCVLEQEHQLGGCLQSYSRFGQTLDTGLHYVGGLDEGRPLHRLFSYFNLMSLPWQRLDEDRFDEVFLEGRSFPLAQGHSHFVQRLAHAFPLQKENLLRFDAAQQNLSNHLFDALHPRLAADFYNNPAFSTSAYDFLCQTVSDPLLRDVLSGSSLKMELNPTSLPFYVFGQINNSFVEGAYRLRGGGSLLVNQLLAQLRAMGVEVLTDVKVSSLSASAGTVSTARSVDGQIFEGRQFISDVHPAVTLQWLDAESGLRRIYRNRITRMENTYGIFTASLILQPKSIPYLNRNIFVHRQGNLWHRLPQEGVNSVMASFYCPKSGDSFAPAIDLLTPVSPLQMQSWQNTSFGNRPDSYLAFKQQLAQQCIQLAQTAIPHLESSIAHISTSSPLSYQHYTSTPQGSAYGLRKDCNNTMLTFLPPRTPLSNLYLTGQSLNLHGLLGVSMTSFLTAGSILGLDAATDGLL